MDTHVSIRQNRYQNPEILIYAQPNTQHRYHLHLPK